MTEDIHSVPTGKSEGKKDNAEDQEKYLLHNPDQIVAKLRLLAKNNNLLTAYFNDGAASMNTCVIDVIRDMDLVALDYGGLDSINEQLLNAKKVIFVAQFDGITVKFSANSITKAKYHGEPVFAVPIPDDLLWLQRRE
jgi:c-di-GMP-binding flagellar brake protein YcgR